MDGPKDCHREWRKSEKQILMLICEIWKYRYRQSYLQSINRDTDIVNKCIDTKGERGKWDELGYCDQHIFTTDAMFKIDN